MGTRGRERRKSAFDPQPLRSTCQNFAPFRNAQRVLRAGAESESLCSYG